jgi:hypothetical protein
MKIITLMALLAIFSVSNAHAGRLQGVATLDVASIGIEAGDSGEAGTVGTALIPNKDGSFFAFSYSLPKLTIYNRNPFPVNTTMTVNVFRASDQTAFNKLRQVISVPANGQFIFEFNESPLVEDFFTVAGACDHDLQVVQYNGLSSIFSFGSAANNVPGGGSNSVPLLPLDCFKAKYTIDLYWSDELSVANETANRFGTTRLTYPLMAETSNTMVAALVNETVQQFSVPALVVATNNEGTYKLRTTSAPKYLIRVQE